MVTFKINGHGDKRSSEIITPKTFKGFNNDITQIQCQDKHCLNIFCHLVCAILLFTPLRYESLKTVYLLDVVTTALLYLRVEPWHYPT